MPSTMLAQLYPAHLATAQRRAETALERVGREHLVIAAGTAQYRFLDDMTYPFHVSPQFKAWLPVTRAPGSWIVVTPGRRPKLIYLQPHDYWHVVPEAPAGYWVDHFDVTIVREAADALDYLPDAERSAIVGEPSSAIDGYVPDNPETLLNYLHYHRAWKTEYELAMMRVASKLGVRAHRAAEAAFRAGKSEYDIHMAYLAAAHETENELPYGNIIGLNEHGAVLHYTDLDRNPPTQSHSFLIDAGASSTAMRATSRARMPAATRGTSARSSTRSMSRSAASSRRCGKARAIRTCTCTRTTCSPGSCATTDSSA
jgi:Xaa-Pro dipeptidase